MDDQVITLLVYKLPQVEVNFYRYPGIFFAGQMGQLPLQVTNLGRSLAVLGNMKVTAENAEVTNNVALVGALDAGGYFTLDPNLVPYQPGPLELKITVNYTDDFNQPRSIEQTLTIDVMEMVIEPPIDKAALADYLKSHCIPVQELYADDFAGCANLLGNSCYFAVGEAFLIRHTGCRSIHGID